MGARASSTSRPTGTGVTPPLPPRPFLLAGTISELRFLKPALAAILVFVGAKMLLTDTFKVEPLVSLAVIVAILAVATGASLRWPGGTHKAGRVQRPAVETS